MITRAGVLITTRTNTQHHKMARSITIAFPYFGTWPRGVGMKGIFEAIQPILEKRGLLGTHARVAVICLCGHHGGDVVVG